MKRLTAILLAFLMVISFAACSGSSRADYKKDGYITLLDNAIKLPSEYSEALVKKVLWPGEIDFMVKSYSERGKDYMALLEEDFTHIRENYSEVYGEDWKLSYTIDSVDEKDEKGIENYKNFDGFYFDSYGVDTSRIRAVTFLKVTVRIEGSRDQNEKQKTIQCFCIDNEWYSFYAIRLGVNL